MKQNFDIAVLGGGPSGSCAAIRLLQLGYRVCLIEKQKFPRNNIGESLSPGVRNIFSYIGAENVLNNDLYLENISASVIWESKDPNFIPASQRGPGIIVDRGQMDLALLNIAKDRGLTVFQPSRVSKISENSLTFTSNNQKHEIDAELILDARGNIGNSSESKLATAEASIAIWVDLSCKIPMQTLVEAQNEGWLWGSPLPNQKFRVMFYCDPKFIRSSNLLTTLKKQISRSKLFSKLNIPSGQNVQTCIVRPFINNKPWHENIISVGDCVFSMDPLSSTGVEKAMRIALQASIAANTVLKAGNEKIARDYYLNKIAESVSAHTRWTCDYYQSAWPDNSFWEKRSQKLSFPSDSLIGKLISNRLEETTASENFDSEISISQTAKLLWDKNLHISSECKYEKSLCVVDDLIKENYALKHPALTRSVAFLGNIYIYPFLQEVNGSKTFGQLINDWSRAVPHKQSAKILSYLFSKKIIEY